MIKYEDIGKLISKRDSVGLLDGIYKILNTKKRPRDGFPGMHPVTFHRYHFPLLLKEDFLVCEKSDGLRLQLYIVNNKGTTHIFFYDRKLSFYKLPFSCKIKNDHLFDVEFLVEGNNIHFLVFDTLIFNSECVFEKNLLERLSMAQSFVNLLHSIKFPIKITIKRMYKPYGIMDAYKHSTQSAVIDGLIFTPVNYPYILGSSKKLLKWKPPHLNTIDFLIRKTTVDNIYKLYCFTKDGAEVFFDYFLDLPIQDKLEEEIKIPEILDTEKSKRKIEEENDKKISKCEISDYDDKIGEFTFDKDKYSIDLIDGAIIKGCWALYKIREDKKRPNPMRIVVNILESMEDEVEYDDFIKYVKEIRDNWKERENIKKHSIK